MARVVVDVMLKPEILDPQGRAVQGALGRLGLDGVTNVRQGKQFVIDIEGDLDGDRAALLEQLRGGGAPSTAGGAGEASSRPPAAPVVAAWANENDPRRPSTRPSNDSSAT